MTIRNYYYYYYYYYNHINLQQYFIIRNELTSMKKDRLTILKQHDRAYFEIGEVVMAHHCKCVEIRNILHSYIYCVKTN